MKKTDNILVWQWGRRGAGPKIAVEFSNALRSVVNSNVYLSLSTHAEIIAQNSSFKNDIPVKTYQSIGGYLKRVVQSPLLMIYLYKKIKNLKISLAICTMPGPLDLLMVATLKLLRIPCVVIIHDVYPHPGDGYIGQHFLQNQLIKQSSLVVTFSQYIYEKILSENIVNQNKVIAGWHPAFSYSAQKNYEKSRGKEVRLLNFGRLLFYKGLDLLDESLKKISSNQPYIMRIVGYGPQTVVLDRLNEHPNVVVENRWVPENEIADLMEWADVVILPYREASQSGIAATALAFGKPILITNVGGLAEQFKHEDLVFLCEPTIIDIAKGLETILKLSFPLTRKKHDAEEEWKKLARHVVDTVTSKLA
ncbi:glycosyltransferase family 4 protein [Commensalibacter oyaizuii]|uniref:Glycosyltransferase family 4 protein n=1 Tax=Commensalibacter oyaizuii TaxID=3043873 RepID=A0ABT6PZP0_9PROT|nr:glycosyltransferase family 4 protein [Commensalibacter sp. TBRC 16381]MDI2090332.1 glycosyltransferase family 4 protein [Commensalibacter sp. TBRC 16381]